MSIKYSSLRDLSVEGIKHLHFKKIKKIKNAAHVRVFWPLIIPVKRYAFSFFCALRDADSFMQGSSNPF